MKELKYNDKVILEGHRGRVFTTAGYAKLYGENPYEALKRAFVNNHDIFCISKEPTILSNDVEFMKSNNRKWQNAIELENGEVVEIEGNKLRVRFRGNYSDMASFEFV